MFYSSQSLDIGLELQCFLQSPNKENVFNYNKEKKILERKILVLAFLSL